MRAGKTTVRVWDVANGRELAHLAAPGAETVSIDPSGARVLIRGPGLDAPIWTLDQPCAARLAPAEAQRPRSLPTGGRSRSASRGSGPARRTERQTPAAALPSPGSRGASAPSPSPPTGCGSRPPRPEISGHRHRLGKRVSSMKEPRGRPQPGLQRRRQAARQRGHGGRADLGRDDRRAHPDDPQTGGRSVARPFDPSGSLVLTPDEGGGVRLWDVDTGEVLARSRRLDAAFVAPADGNLVAIVGSRAATRTCCRCELVRLRRRACASARASASRAAPPERDEALG